MFTRYFLVALIGFTLGSASSCASTQQPNTADVSTNVALVQEIGNGIYIRPKGWSLPPWDLMTQGESGVGVLENTTGKLVATTYTMFRPAEELITNPFEGTRLSGDFRIMSIARVEVRGKIYLYSATGAAVVRDEKTGQFVRRGGPTFWSHIDRDGDGIIETLNAGSEKLGPSWIDEL